MAHTEEGYALRYSGRYVRVFHGGSLDGVVKEVGTKGTYFGPGKLSGGRWIILYGDDVYLHSEPDDHDPDRSNEVHYHAVFGDDATALILEAL